MSYAQTLRNDPVFPPKYLKFSLAPPRLGIDKAHRLRL
jgi:hypothetical protein